MHVRLARECGALWRNHCNWQDLTQFACLFAKILGNTPFYHVFIMIFLSLLCLKYNYSEPVA